MEVVKEGLLELGLITDKEDQYRTWLPHGTSHWLGMNAHDVGDRNARLEPGMVMTVEPGLYFRPNALDILRSTDEKLAMTIEGPFNKYRGIGVRIEDDVLVTSSGCEILSIKAPKTIGDIEALQRSK